MNLLLLVLIVVVLLVIYLFRPIRPLAGPAAKPGPTGKAGARLPASGYQEAVLRIEAMRQAEAQETVKDVCQSILLSHGERTRDVLVLLHGFTNCPEQFHELGRRLHALGYTVFIPRTPWHGLSDRLTHDISKLTAEEMVGFANQVVDVAHGLGERVTVSGISGGGTIACWVGQNRADVDIAMPIAAMLGVAFVPGSFTQAFARLFNHLPDFYMWWDPRTKDKNPFSIDYAYPGYSVHSMSEVLRLGVIVRQQAVTQPPAAKKIVMVLNESEPGVSNPELEKITADWQKNRANTELSTFRLPAKLKLPHDIITPETPGLPVEAVYALLIQCIQSETSV